MARGSTWFYSLIADDTSMLTPGSIVELSDTFFMYVPFEPDGLALATALMKARTFSTSLSPALVKYVRQVSWCYTLIIGSGTDMFRCTAIQVSHIGKNRLGNLVQSYYGATKGCRTIRVSPLFRPRRWVVRICWS